MSEDLIERLRNTSNMINMGEKISWGQDTALMDEAAAEIERLCAKLAFAKEVIAPFAECGRSHTDEHGWIDGFGNERLCNWIGPSDLRAAAEWMEKGDE